MPNKNRFLQLRFSLDPERLKNDLAICLRRDWKAHFNTRDYSGNWTSISLRSASGDESDILPVQSESGYVDTPLLKECNYFQEILDYFKCDIEAVRLLNLAPGAEIKLHSDHKTGYQHGFFRLHIPITTNEGVFFEIDGIKLQMREGECWYADFSLPHSAKNEGEEDRIHLIIDCRRNDFTDELFKKAGYDFEAEGSAEEINNLIIERLQEMNTPAARKLIREIRDQIQTKLQ